jgi:hypothetical protein
MQKEELLVVFCFIYFILFLFFNFIFTKTGEEDAGAQFLVISYFISLFILQKQLKRMQKEELLVILCELYKECMTIKQVIPPSFFLSSSFEFLPGF